MNNSFEDLLSKKAKIAFNILLGLTALSLFYFHFLSQGPMYWVSGWIADRNGSYSVMLAFLLSFFPFLVAEWMIVYLIDRFASWRRTSS